MRQRVEWLASANPETWYEPHFEFDLRVRDKSDRFESNEYFRLGGKGKRRPDNDDYTVVWLECSTVDLSWRVQREWRFWGRSDGFCMALGAAVESDYRPLVDWLIEHEEGLRGPAVGALLRLAELIKD
jgi:hypothetical protein